MRSSLHWAVAVAIALSVLGCSRCGKAGSSGSKAELEKLLPQQAELIVQVPDLNKLGEKITRLQELRLMSFAAQLQGMPSGADFASALFAQMGVDLRSRESVENAGIDGSRGLAIALLAGNQGYSVVGVKDEGKFKAFLATLARNRLGAPVEETQSPSGTKLTVFSRAPGQPALGYRLVGGYALVAPAESFAHIAAPLTGTLADDGTYQEGMKAVSKRDVLFYLPESSKQLPSEGARGVSAGLDLTAEALTFTAHVALRRTEAAALFEPKDAPALTAHLPADAFLVTRYRGDPLLLQYLWPTLAGPRLVKAFEEAGFDVGNDVLQNLKPGVVAALALSPSLNLGGGMPELDVRRTNPFRYVSLVAVAEVKDQNKASATFDKLPAIAPRFSAKLTPVEKAGKKILEASYAQGEGTHLAIVDDRVLLAAPMTRMEQALSGEKKTGSPVAAELAPALENPAFAAVLDFQKLAAAVRQLPDSAWGLGGFAMKASTLRWLEGLSELRGLWVTAKSNNGAVDAEISLRFAKP